MTWQNKLRPASFRGITFEVESRALETGRRGQLHEYPNRDIPYFEDLGKKTTTYAVEGFIIGEDYAERRDALINACNAEGSATFVHPDYGELEVYCTGCSVAETFSEGRMAKFSLQFTIAGEQASPTVTIDFKDKINFLADDLSAASKGNFLSNFNILGKSTAVIKGITGVANDLLDKAQAALGFVSSNLELSQNTIDKTQSPIDDITNISDRINKLTQNAEDILKSPQEFLSVILDSFSAIRNYFNPSQDSLKLLNNMSNLEVVKIADKINQNIPRNVEEVEMMFQIELLAQRASLVEQAKVISEIEFKTSKDAQKLLNEFVEQVDYQLLTEVSTDNEVFQILQQLQASLAKYVSFVIKRLPEVKNVQLSAATPALVLAYDLYQDIEREEEIINRNNIPNPGFVPAGVNIEVLTA
jgi:prophage DNA circulation protein